MNASDSRCRAAARVRGRRRGPGGRRRSCAGAAPGCRSFPPLSPCWRAACLVGRVFRVLGFRAALGASLSWNVSCLRSLAGCAVRALRRLKLLGEHAGAVGQGPEGKAPRASWHLLPPVPLPWTLIGAGGERESMLPRSSHHSKLIQGGSLELRRSRDRMHYRCVYLDKITQNKNRMLRVLADLAGRDKVATLWTALALWATAAVSEARLCSQPTLAVVVWVALFAVPPAYAAGRPVPHLPRAPGPWLTLLRVVSGPNWPLTSSLGRACNPSSLLVAAPDAGVSATAGVCPKRGIKCWEGVPGAGGRWTS